MSQKISPQSSHYELNSEARIALHSAQSDIEKAMSLIQANDHVAAVMLLETAIETTRKAADLATRASVTYYDFLNT